MSGKKDLPVHILITDDNLAISSLLRHLLEADGHRVTIAQNGREALDMADADPLDLVLLDLDMPLMGGFEVCSQLKQEPATRLLPVLIITGREPSDARLRAWELGTDDFLTKPFQPVDVRARSRSLLRVKRLTDALDSVESVVYAFARAVEAKSPYTYGRSDRMTDYALTLARRVGLTGDALDVLRRGSLLHDLGKISIPDAILDKPGPLTVAEYERVKQHPSEGVRILEQLRSVRAVLPLVRWHHERLDGKGYPDGLQGDAIPLSVRIL